MELYQVIVLALVQGITEFLPISSQAHLIAVPWLLGWRDPGLTFDIALHLGTLVAVLLFFFRDWLQIIAQGFGLSAGADPQLKQNRALLWYLIAATIPAAAVGAAFRHQADNWRNPLVIGGMLILIGLWMWFAEAAGKGNKNMAAVSFADAGVVGVSQALAVVPGVSRSGVTIATALFRNLDRETSARFSFLLSTPIIAGAAASDLLKRGAVAPGMQTPFLVGILVSAITGCAVIAFFLKYLRRHTLKCFVYYRLIFGIILIALAFFRRPAG